MRKMLLFCALLTMGLAVTALADDTGRIYGKILTIDGDVLEGYIRWDKNEANWFDILHGTKERARRNLRAEERSERRRYSDRKSSIRIFGIKIGETGDTWNYSSSSSAGIRFGHIKTLEVIDDDRALLILKSGEEVEFENSSTDLGSGIREIVIEDRNEGELELVWDDIERIDFMEGRGDKSAFGNRLYGTLTTRRGQTFTGFVCWDIDELFESDVLDGEESRRKRRIKFGKIASIERYSSSGARVVLKSGDELVLRGTNDVNDENRGIVIADPGLGDVTVEWSEFDRIEFSEPKSGIRYEDFDGGRKIRGTVYTEDNEKYTGIIRWDNDEEFTWEILDGSRRDIEFDIEMSMVKTIVRDGYRGSEVTLRDGRVFDLRDSNDIDDDNKGIYIVDDDGEEIVVHWDDFEKIEFD